MGLNRYWRRNRRNWRRACQGRRRCGRRRGCRHDGSIVGCSYFIVAFLKPYLDPVSRFLGAATRTLIHNYHTNTVSVNRYHYFKWLSLPAPCASFRSLFLTAQLRLSLCSHCTATAQSRLPDSIQLLLMLSTLISLMLSPGLCSPSQEHSHTNAMRSQSLTKQMRSALN